MPYKSRTEFQADELQNGENWILSSVTNRPHNVLSDNCDYLRERVGNVASKLGLDSNQEKLDGFPIFHGTHYVKTGMTYTQALSTLDREIRILENLYRFYLETQLMREALEWTLGVSDAQLVVIPDTTSYPGPIKINDFSNFLTLSYNNNNNNILTYMTGDDAEQGWKYYTSLTDIFPKSCFALEKPTTTQLFYTPTSASTSRVDLFAGYTHELAGTENLSVTPNFVKYTGGTLNYTNNTITFDVTTNSAAANYNPQSVILDLDYILYDYIRFITSFRLGTTNFFYLLPTSIDYKNYSTGVLDRAKRLVKVSDILSYAYTPGDIANRTVTKGINIEGASGDYLDYISYLEIKVISGTEMGMVVCDHEGKIWYRTSSDGINWNQVSGAFADGLIASSTNTDFPTFIPLFGGAICIFNTDYNQSVLDDLYFSYTRDGKTWTTPTSLGVAGMFPVLITRRNRNFYLYFFSINGIEIRRIFVGTSNVY